ncbi:MAG: hypothetical protein L6Q76_08175 [Polyangiaceae bacterium]|nr:hypothetical protein [Polyangiaceae bacterium]
MPSWGRTEPGTARAAGLFAVFAAAIFLAQPVRAADSPPLDNKARAQVRSLADQGQALYDKGDFKGAVESFSKAEAIAPVPTVQVALAKALLKLGRLTQAAAFYEKASNAEVTAESPPSLIEAVAQAKNDLRELLLRVPTLEIAASAGVSGIAIDGRPIPPLELSAPIRLDPGDHRVTAEGLPSQRISLAPGDRKRIVLAPPPAPEETNWRYVGGIAGIGVSAVALGIGIASTVRMVQLGRDFDRYRVVSPYSAQPDICAFAEQTENDPALLVDSRAIVSICKQTTVFTVLQLVMYPLHAGAAAGGIYLLMTSGGSAKKPAASAFLSPRVGLGAAALDLSVQF